MWNIVKLKVKKTVDFQISPIVPDRSPVLPGASAKSWVTKKPLWVKHKTWAHEWEFLSSDLRNGTCGTSLSFTT